MAPPGVEEEHLGLPCHPLSVILVWVVEVVVDQVGQAVAASVLQMMTYKVVAKKSDYLGTVFFSMMA